MLHSPKIWSNNLEVASFVPNPIMHVRTKHIEIDLHFVRDKVIQRELEIWYVPSKEQLAGIFTKALFTSRFEFLKDKLKIYAPLSAWDGAVD